MILDLLKGLLGRRIKARTMLFVALLLIGSAPAWAASERSAVRMGMPVSLFNRQYMLIEDLRQYLASKLNRQVEIVMNKKFSNNTVQFYVEKLDYAWVTDYPDFHLKKEIRLLAIPLFKGRPYFTSYLIVPAQDDKTKNLP
jgi:phosphonate transport system substrate-binding protein